ncbi:MAG: ion transporter [Nitrosomonadales bacterium]|nr:ion transporter [Nitrosomonadales bacterium]
MFSQKVEWFLIVLVILNVTAITLGTVKTIYSDIGAWLYIFEGFCVTVFVVEYAMRLYKAPTLEQYSGKNGRIRYLFTGFALIDFFAIAPYFLAFLIGTDSNASLLRIMRVLTLFRLAKLLRYQKAFRLIGGVLKSKGPELSVCGLLICLYIFISAVILYVIENEAQPQVFSSIPASLWWAVVSITTIGYGDIVPVTTLGKVVSGLLVFVGVALIAIPTSIIAGGFIEATTREKAEEIRREGAE